MSEGQRDNLSLWVWEKTLWSRSILIRRWLRIIFVGLFHIFWLEKSNKTSKYVKSRACVSKEEFLLETEKWSFKQRLCILIILHQLALMAHPDMLLNHMRLRKETEVMGKVTAMPSSAKGSLKTQMGSRYFQLKKKISGSLVLWITFSLRKCSFLIKGLIDLQIDSLSFHNCRHQPLSSRLFLLLNSSSSLCSFTFSPLLLRLLLWDLVCVVLRASVSFKSSSPPLPFNSSPFTNTERNANTHQKRPSHLEDFQALLFLLSSFLSFSRCDPYAGRLFFLAAHTQMCTHAKSSCGCVSGSPEAHWKVRYLPL